MTTAKADFLHFLTSGHLGPFTVGGSWSNVESTLGVCEDYGVDRWGTGYGSYGCIEFTVQDGEILVIKLRLSTSDDDDGANGPTPELPAALEMTSFENPQLPITETRRILEDAGVAWGRVASLCDFRTTYYQTSNGVHLIFENGTLVTICAQAVFDGKIE